MKFRMILKSQKTNAKKNDGPKEYTCQFWEPGLVSYEDSGAGKALLRKEAMDGMLPSFIGKPVTIDHVEGSPEQIMNAGKAVGKVTQAYWNPDTGWYECKFTVENEDARKKVESGWSVSCAFDVSEQTGPGGEYHAIPFDEEITSGTFTHLALVENPRYEDSKIFKNARKMFLNSKGAKMVVNKKPLDGVVDIGMMNSKKNDTTHQYPDYSDLAEEIISTIRADKITESACISYALETGKTRADGQKAWQEILREFRGLKNSSDYASRRAQAQKKWSQMSIDQRIALVKKTGGWANDAQINDLSQIGGSAEETIVDQLVPPGRQNENLGDFGTILREIKEQLYQMAQALGSKFSGKENEKMSLSQALIEAKKELFPDKDYHLLTDAESVEVTIRAREIQKRSNSNQKSSKNARVILKPRKQNSQEKKPMFGLFKRKSKKNEAPVQEKLPVENIVVPIDGVEVPLSELVAEYKAEQAEIAEKAKLEQQMAAKEVENAPEGQPEAPAEGQEPAPEDLNLDNQEFTLEDGSRFNVQEMINCWTSRKARKNAEAEEKAKEEADKKAAEEAAAKAKANEGETPEEKAAREKKEADDKAAKENAAAEEEAKKKAEEEAKAKENAKKNDPKYFHKLNDLKNQGEIATGRAVDTLADKLERGKNRYGSKKK